MPAPSGGWNIKKGGTTRADRHFDRKNEAVSYARRVSRIRHTELYIHRKDGTIQQKESDSKDHYPPRDRDTHY